MKILKFQSDWCAPCKVQKTMMHGFDKCPVEEINIENGDERVSLHNIKSVPTLILVNEDGEELWRKSGLTNIMEIEKSVSKHIKVG